MWFWITTLIVFAHLQNGIWSNALPVTDDGYVFKAGIGYHKVYSQAETSDTARSICQEEGGDLAIIDSEQESRIIFALFTLSLPHTGSYNSDYALVGFHDRIVDVQYPTFQDGNLESAVYSERRWNEPSIAKRKGENCESIDSSGQLHGISCNQPYAFVCERPEYEKEICGKAVEMNVTVAKELIIEGGKISIACYVVGYPASRILWYKDYELIQTNDRINISEGNELIIPKANKNDAGKYRCETANKHKSGAHTVDIKVIVPVKVRIAVDDGPFPKGSEISIACNTDGYPTPTIQWYKNDNHIERNKRINIVANKLIISTAEENDAGKYRCEAANEYTSSAETVDIKVAAPIKVTIAARKGPFLKGSQFSISCHVDGYPTPNVFWYKDDTRIRASNRIRISANELMVSAADNNDTGRYRCEAANEYTSSAGIVDIEVAVPVKVKMTLNDGPFPKGSEISIACNTDGYPTPTVRWYKNDNHIEGNKRINIVANKLIISTAEENDAGKYRCEAANEYTSSAETVDVKVAVPVKVKMAVNDGPFPKGSEISIACNIDGYPTPTVRWYKNDNHIERNKRINIVANKLIISTAEENDAGKYRCEAANKFTSSAETVDVKVAAPIKVTIAARKGPFLKGSQFSISCHVDGYPTPNVFWYKDDTRIRASNRIRISANELMVSAADNNDTGRYRCEAANEYTSSVGIVDIEVAVPVKVKMALNDGPFPKGSEISIACNTDGYPTPTVRWYKNDNYIEGNRRINIVANKLIISTAEENDAGKYRCEAANKFTSSAETVDVKVAAPIKVTIAARKGLFPKGRELRISCDVDGYSSPKVLWYKDDTRIRASNRIRISANELIIPAADNNDTGRYRCEAVNEYTSSTEMVDIKVVECGTEIADETQLIANGSKVLHGRFPWFVRIYKIDSTGSASITLKGTLISPNLVLSLAFWFYDETSQKPVNAHDYVVVAGQFSGTYSTLGPYAQKSPIKRIDITTQYGRSLGKSEEDDTALIYLKTPLTMTTLVKPICIDWENEFELKQRQSMKDAKKVYGNNFVSAATGGLESHEIDSTYIPREECLLRVSDKQKVYLKGDTFCVPCPEGSATCAANQFPAAIYYEYHGIWYLLGVSRLNLLNQRARQPYLAVFEYGQYLDQIRAALLTAF